MDKQDILTDFTRGLVLEHKTDGKEFIKITGKGLKESIYLKVIKSNKSHCYIVFKEIPKKETTRGNRDYEIDRVKHD